MPVIVHVEAIRVRDAKMQTSLIVYIVHVEASAHSTHREEFTTTEQIRCFLRGVRAVAGADKVEVRGLSF